MKPKPKSPRNLDTWVSGGVIVLFTDSSKDGRDRENHMDVRAAQSLVADLQDRIRELESVGHERGGPRVPFDPDNPTVAPTA